MPINGLFTRKYRTHLAIDEVALSQGELYTIVTNKRLSERFFSGTCSALRQDKSLVSKIDSKKKRQAAIEITLDMANSMKLIAKKMFSKSHTSNRSFPCTKLALEALQEIRIKHRWKLWI
jgi:hypothetical protein